MKNIYIYIYIHSPVNYSTNQRQLTNTIAPVNIINFSHLYLDTLNSSTITSTVEIYKNVPTDIDTNIPVINGP